MMVALTIGVILIGAVIGIYLAQSKVYKGANSQASIQNAENAIAALLVPTVRAAGFGGCSTLGSAVSNLVAGGPPPLGALATTPAMVAGYDYVNTAGAGTALAITADNPPNDSDPTHWSPTLDSTLGGAVLPGSDVLIVLGAAPGSQPVGVATITAGSTSITVQDASGLAAGQVAAVSDCLKSSIFLVTAVNSNALVHAAGAGAMTNATAALSVNYPPGAQLVPLRQTAFFVGHGLAGQSVLMRATLVGSTWDYEPLVPGIETMQVLYGVGTAADGVITRYVAAGAVTDWSLVYSVHLAFLIEGQAGSVQGGGASAPLLLGTTVTPPPDTRLRHVYETAINLRNAAP